MGVGHTTLSIFIGVNILIRKVFFKAPGREECYGHGSQSANRECKPTTQQPGSVSRRVQHTLELQPATIMNGHNYDYRSRSYEMTFLVYWNTSK